MGSIKHVWNGLFDYPYLGRYLAKMKSTRGFSGPITEYVVEEPFIE